jgi:hypothetical protein
LISGVVLKMADISIKKITRVVLESDKWFKDSNNLIFVSYNLFWSLGKIRWEKRKLNVNKIVDKWLWMVENF